MPTPTIVVGFDATAGAHAALLAGIDLALAMNDPIVVVHVEHSSVVAASGASIGVGGGAVFAAEDALGELCRTECSEILGDTGLRWSFELRKGDPANELINAASEHSAAVIVVGRHGHHGLGRLLVGSVSHRLVNHARHPILVIPPPAVNHPLILIDEKIVVSCPTRKAMTLLGGPGSIAAWFGANWDASATTIRSNRGDLIVKRTHEQWMPPPQLLSVDGAIGQVRFHGHVTLISYPREATADAPDDGIEIWVHVELSPTEMARCVASILQPVIVQGLEQLRLELDKPPNPSEPPQ